MKLSKKKRADLMQMFDGHCAYCGETLTSRFHADHVIPVVRNTNGTLEYPENDNEDNLVPACARCNNYKHSMTPEQFRQSIRNALDNRMKNSGFNLLVRFGFLQIKPFPEKILFYYETFIKAPLTSRLEEG